MPCLYYGLAFDLSLQPAQFTTDDAGNIKGNNYSGGQSIVPSLGLASLGAHHALGIYANYRIRDQRTVEMAVTGNYSISGGSQAKGGVFWEHFGDTWKIGASLGTEYDTASTGSDNSSGADPAFTPEQFIGVVNLYSTITAGKVVDFIPQVSYMTEADRAGYFTNNQMNMTLAARMVF